MSVPEEEVLKPIDPSIQDENQWEEFLLTDVEVRDSNSSLASLLDADESLPLTVTGVLETLEPEQRHCLLVRYYRTEPLVVSDVRRYAYGQYDDGSAEIWAAGNAGWFKIQPAESYQGIYQGMLDAINIFYFVADAHRGDGSKKKTKAYPTAEALFEEYSTRPSSNVESARAAAKHMYDHRDFLIYAMLKGKEGIDWPSTPLYSHLERKFMADFIGLRKKLGAANGIANGRGKPASRRARSNTNSSIGSTIRHAAPDRDTDKQYACDVCGKMYGSKQGLKYHQQHSALCDPELPNSRAKAGQHERSSRRSSRASAGTPASRRKPSAMNDIDAPVLMGTPERGAGSSQSIHHSSAAMFILKAVKKLDVSHRQQLTIRKLAALLFQRFELISEAQAANLVRANASSLRKVLDRESHAKVDWKKTPLYRELVNARLPDEKIKELYNVKLRWKNAALDSTLPRGPLEPDSGSDSEGIPGRRAYKGKSVLRPKASKLSNKGAGRDEVSAEEEHSDVVGYGTSTKRKRNSSTRLASQKRSTNYCVEMDIDMPSPPESASQPDEAEEAVEEELEPATSNLPLRLKSDPDYKLEPPLFTIVEIPLPSYTAQGPDDTWTCTFDGCMHKIYAASEAEGKGFIEDHYEKHAAEERVNLVYKEQRPHLPVGHLIKRIRELAEQQQALALFDGVKMSTVDAFPKPIDRRY